MVEKKKIKEHFRKYLAKYRGYVPGEQPDGSGWIKLNTNENPYEPPQEIIKAIKEGLVDLRKYPDLDAKDVKKQLTYNIRPGKNHALKMDNIVFGSGEDDLLDMAFKVFVDPGDKVITFAPTYGMYSVLCDVYGGKLVEIPLGPDFSFPEEKALAATGKLFIVCSPNNPNGARASNEFISKLCAAFDGIVIVDEAYVDFARESALPLLLEHENLIILRTFSKSFSLASLRVGYLLSFNRDIVLAFRKVKLPYNVNLAGQVAALAALKHQEKVDEIVARVASERDRLSAALQAIEGLKVLPSEANFLLVKVDLGDQSRNMKVNQKLFWELKNRKVLVRKYNTKGLYEFLRITVGTPEQNDKLAAEMVTCMAIAMQQA